MNIRKINSKASAIVFLTLITFVLTATGCYEEQKVSARDSGGGMKGDVVIASVNDRDITLVDLGQSAEFYGFLDQAIIKREILFQEAMARGIEITQKEIMDTVEMQIESQGGWEGAADMFPPEVPKQLIRPTIIRFTTSQMLQGKILDALFEEEHGPITDTEIEELWEQNKVGFQTQTAGESEVEIDPETVTMEQARSFIEEHIRNTWKQANAQQFFEGLPEKYDVEIYLKETLPEEVPDFDIPVVKIDETHESESDVDNEHESPEDEHDHGDSEEHGEDTLDEEAETEVEGAE